MIAELLKMIGLPGQLVLVASTAVALWHGHSAMQIAAMAGMWLRFAGLFAFGIVLLVSGVIPGLHLQVDISVLTDVVEALWRSLPLGGV